MSTLYLVATPIGNLDDITLRAVRVLGEVWLIAAEDTRSARILLRHIGVQARVTSYNDHNARAKTPSILRALDDGDVAVISDAGMPGISDPGHDLVVAALDADHEVVPIPGASAVIAAVAASGLPSRRFHYLGFLSRQSGPRRRALAAAAMSGDTLVVYESPHRVRATLEDVRAALGNRRIAVCRELTKMYEEIWRGTVSGALDHFASPRGEFTLVIEGGAAPAAQPVAGEPRAVVAELQAAGLSARDGVAELARRLGLSRRAAYALWHERSRNIPRTRNIQSS
jgi:16S rRNA (cytidine1402-2'-O)-methyltransferase